VAPVQNVTKFTKTAAAAQLVTRPVALKKKITKTVAAM